MREGCRDAAKVRRLRNEICEWPAGPKQDGKRQRGKGRQTDRQTDEHTDGRVDSADEQLVRKQISFKSSHFASPTPKLAAKTRWPVSSQLRVHSTRGGSLSSVLIARQDTEMHTNNDKMKLGPCLAKRLDSIRLDPSLVCWTPNRKQLQARVSPISAPFFRGCSSSSVSKQWPIPSSRPLLHRPPVVAWAHLTPAQARTSRASAGSV